MRSQYSKTAITLGWLGVIPFVFAAIISFSNDSTVKIFSAELISRYGLAIIIFLGAVQWGIAMTDSNSQSPTRYLWSITPALIATLIMLIAPSTSLIMVILLLITCWVVDMIFHIKSALPKWYVRLRHGLTLMAVCSVIVVTINVSSGAPIWP